MLRLGLVSCGVVTLLLGTGAAAATSPVGTWKILPKLQDNEPPGLPWADGKQTVTVRSSSEGEVKGLWSPSSDVALHYCGTSSPQQQPPSISGWYTATFSWLPGARVGGCTSNKTVRQGDPYIEASGPGGRVALGITRGIFYGCFEGGHCFQAKRESGGCPAPDRESMFGGNAWSPQKCTTKTINAPPPGKSVEVQSPPLPATPKVDITVSSSKDDAEELAIFGPADVEAAVAVLWVNCWTLNGQDQKEPGLQKFAVKFCVDIVKAVLKSRGFEFGKKQGGRGPAASETSRHTAATGCTSKPLAFRAQLKKGSKKTITSLRRASRKPSANSVRYSCAISAGQMKVTVQTSRKGGLRKALGKTLDLAVHRSKNAPKGGKLTFTFGW